MKEILHFETWDLLCKLFCLRPFEEEMKELEDITVLHNIGEIVVIFDRTSISQDLEWS